MRTFLHGFNQTADAFAHLIFFGRDALFVGHDRLVLAEIHNHIRAVKTADRSAHDVTHAVFVFGQNHRLFRLAHFLHQRLFGVLRCHTAKAIRRHFLFNFITHLGVGLEATRIEQGNLIVLRNDFFRDDEFGKCFDVAVFGIHLDAQLASGADRFFGRRQ